MAVDHKELEALLGSLEAAEKEMVEHKKKVARNLAARLLRDTVKNTPVGIYPADTGKVGGTLRRGWQTSETKEESGGITIDMFNPTEYASYVEYGHRQEVGRYVPALGKRLKSPWVEGRFMMTNAERRLAVHAQAITDSMTQAWLEGLRNGR